jgi:hypothetical protein
MKWDFLKLLVGSISSIFLAFFVSAKISRKTPQNAPILPEPSNPPPMPKKPVYEPPSAPQTMLERFCHAIAQYEGANPANNNPGNCRCSPVGYLPKYGHVTCNPHNFAVFPTYELGWEYLTQLVYHRALAHPKWTILDFFSNYAPTSDGNAPAPYADFVAKACGVDVHKRLADLFGVVS